MCDKQKYCPECKKIVNAIKHENDNCCYCECGKLICVKCGNKMKKL